jgi:nicotinamide mononucleotide (NMN) deamidase PncC
VAVTGIAGPGGETPAKPVGLVHYGVDVGGEVRLERRDWPGDRRAIKIRAALSALLLLLRTLEGSTSAAERAVAAGGTVRR